MKFDGFIGPTYTLSAPSANAQRLVNLYPQVQESGPRKQNVASYMRTPGLINRATVGSGQIRGVHCASTGQLFVVSDNAVYEVDPAWNVTQRAGALQTHSGRVTMADDGVRLVVGDGSNASYQCPLTAGSALAVIPASCPGGFVTWQDGYFLNNVPGTRKFQFSALDDITYDALDVATKEGRPDNLVMLMSVNRQLWLWGERSGEVWWNSGDALEPWQRIEGAFLEVGTLAPGTCCRAGGSVAWVGSDERGTGTVWHAQGFAPVRISTHAVEYALSSYKRLKEASAFAYQQQGHEFYQLSVPLSDSDPGGTWVYDFATGLWHERSYQSATGAEPHRAWVGCVAFGQVVVGDRDDGRLYTYDLSAKDDDGAPIVCMRQSPHVTQDEKRILFNSFQLQCEPGVGTSTGQGAAPVATLCWSDDGGHTWSNEHQVSLGLQGKYKNRAIWRRLGVSRDRVFRVTVTDPVALVWLGAELDVVQLDA